MISEPTPVQLSFDETRVKLFYHLLNQTPIPRVPAIPTAVPWELGIDIDFLQDAFTKLKTEWSVEELVQKINLYPNFMVHWKDEEKDVEGDLHFVHAKSKRQDAIPLILLHGWPGSFMDFHKIIEPLTNPPDGKPAFHVVIPSLPGYCWSTQPQIEGWNIEDDARLFNKLMTQALGYKIYAGHGGDWGSYILRIIGSLYPEEAPVLHFTMFRCLRNPSGAEEQLSDIEKIAIARRDQFNLTGRGYIEEQRTKPFTIGLAIAASPVSVLVWLGEKFYMWSDPRCLDTKDLLDTVALYYLTDCFASSVLIYNQSRALREDLITNQTKWLVKSKIGFSSFPYEVGGATREDIRAVGPLVFYTEKEKGGHFPALDNPDELVADIREFFGATWR